MDGRRSMEYQCLNKDILTSNAVPSSGEIKLHEEVTKVAEVIPVSTEANSPLNSTIIPVPVKLLESTRWEQRFDHVIGLTCHSFGGEGVTIAARQHKKTSKQCSCPSCCGVKITYVHSNITMYKQDSGCIFFVRKHGSRIDGITASSKLYHAVIDNENDKVKLYYGYPENLGNPSQVIDVHAIRAISGTDNYLVCTSKLESSVRVWCYSVSRGSAVIKWRFGLKWQQTASVSIMEQNHSLLVLAANFTPNGKPIPNRSALLAIDGSKIVWFVSFQALDSTAEHFDLSDMSNDGRYFYVANNRAGCIYLISAEGQVLSKVLENLSTPIHLSINATTKKMVVACNGKLVKVYKLLYVD